jgi:hypothetical protein
MPDLGEPENAKARKGAKARNIEIVSRKGRKNIDGSDFGRLTSDSEKADFSLRSK